MTHELFNVAHARKLGNEGLSRSSSTQSSGKFVGYIPEKLDSHLDFCVLMFDLSVFYFFLKLGQVLTGELSVS